MPELMTISTCSRSGAEEVMKKSAKSEAGIYQHLLGTFLSSERADFFSATLEEATQL